ncbi:hypothetical protein [Acinetobacter rudis]|uniref:hypothetical protein n=1 Tax=Acinetobacter rudis TaxID=632955 RepID=UPI00333F2A83
MPIITVKQDFKIAIENGNKIIVVEKGDQDVSDRVAEVAVNHLKVATFKTKGKQNESVSNTGTGKTTP